MPRSGLAVFRTTRFLHEPSDELEAEGEWAPGERDEADEYATEDFDPVIAVWGSCCHDRSLSLAFWRSAISAMLTTYIGLLPIRRIVFHPLG